MSLMRRAHLPLLLLAVVLVGSGQLSASSEFEPIVYEFDTSVRTGDRISPVEWSMSSIVAPFTASSDAKNGLQYRYTYVFRNNSRASMKISLFSSRVAMSPLFDIMQDFSFTLRAGERRVIAFSTTSAPETIASSVFTSILSRNKDDQQWMFVASGHLPMYIPSDLRPMYIALRQ